MRPARDTFLRFLSDNLSSSIPIHNIRKDVSFPDAAHIKMNAVNVQFLTDAPSVLVSYLTAAVDVVHDNELTAVDFTTQLFTLLSQSGLTPLKDYSDRTNGPVALGSNLFWDPAGIQFRPVYGETYFRRSALITLSYHLY